MNYFGNKHASARSILAAPELSDIVSVLKHHSPVSS